MTVPTHGTLFRTGMRYRSEAERAEMIAWLTANAAHGHRAFNNALFPLPPRNPNIDYGILLVDFASEDDHDRFSEAFAARWDVVCDAPVKKARQRASFSN